MTTINTTNNFSPDANDAITQAIAKIGTATTEISTINDTNAQILSRLEGKADVYNINTIVDKLQENQDTQHTINSTIATSISTIEEYINQNKSYNETLNLNILKLTNNDTSMNSLTSTIIANQNSLQSNNNEIFEKIMEYDHSMNVFLTDKLSQQQLDLTTVIATEIPKEFSSVLSDVADMNTRIIDMVDNDIRPILTNQVSLTADIVTYTTNTNNSLSGILTEINNTNNKSINDVSNIIHTLDNNYNLLFDSINNKDNSFNDIILKITENQVSIDQNYTDTFNRLIENDPSMNILTENIVSAINKISDQDASLNIIQTQMHNSINKLSINQELIQIGIANVDTTLNKLTNNDASRNEIASNITTIISDLNNRDASMNQINSNIIQVMDKLTNNDASMNGVFNNIITSHENISTQINNTIDSLSAKDASVNEILNKTLDNQITIDNNHTTTISKLNNFDISLANISTNLDNNYNSIINKLDNNYSNITSDLTTIDNIIIPSFTTALNSLTTSSNITATSVTTASTALETLLQTIDSNTNTTQQENQKTQQLLVEYIGKHIVIPLFEQRVNDITAQNYGDLENVVLVHLNTALYKFRMGDFEGLKSVFNKTIKDEYTMNIHNLKRTAFVRYMGTTPGANSISDLNVHARSHYKTFKKYITNVYRSLDGLEKSIILYDEFTNLEGINELNKIKADILEDTDKLKEYIANLNKQKNNPALFDVSGSATATPMVKPQYIEYIKRYGVPDKGLFDAQKMSEIIVDLTSRGVMQPLPQYPIEPPYSTSEPNTNTSSSEGTTSDVTTKTDTATATDTATGTDTDTGYDSQGLPLTATGTDTATASDTDTGNDWPDSDDFSEFSESDSDDSDGGDVQSYDNYLAQWIKDYSGNNVDASGNTSGNLTIQF